MSYVVCLFTLGSVLEVGSLASQGARNKESLSTKGKDLNLVELERAGEKLLGLLYSLNELSSRGVESIEDWVKKFVPRHDAILSSNQLQQLFAAVELFAELRVRHSEAVEQTPTRAEAEERFNLLWSEVDVPAGIEVTHDGLSGTISIADPVVEEAFNDVLFNLLQMRHFWNRESILRQSLLTTAVSGMETFMAALFKYILVRNPAVLDESTPEQTFTLKQLEAFGSIEEARVSLIEQKVNTFVSGGVESWLERLKRRDLKLDVTLSKPAWERLQEAFARRNAIVHRDACVDRKYQRVLYQAGIRPLPELGESLDVDETYLRQSLETICQLVISLTVHVVATLSNGLLNEVAIWVASRQAELMRLGFQRVVADFDARPAYSFTRLTAMQLQENRWIALRDLGRFDEVRAEVESWDTSGLSLTHSHVRDVLLDNRENYMASIDSLLKAGDLNLAALHIYPLYKVARERGDFDALFAEPIAIGDIFG